MRKAQVTRELKASFGRICKAPDMQLQASTANVREQKQIRIKDAPGGSEVPLLTLNASFMGYLQKGINPAWLVGNMGICYKDGVAPKSIQQTWNPDMSRHNKDNHKFIKQVITEASHPGPPDSDGYKPASVMALMGMKEKPHLLFIQKADVEGYPWRNQMAFPGGHADPQDASREDTALRELAEEMSISREHVEVMGSLGHFQTINNRDIEAFIGIWDQQENIFFDPGEISRVFEIPVSHLLKTHLKKNFQGRQPDIHELTYPFKDVVIWGVTAKIVHHMMEITLKGLRNSDAD